MTVGYGPQTRLCTCGKAVTGNGAKASHRKACPDGRYYSSHEAYEMRAYAYEMSLNAVIRAAESGTRDGSDV